MYSEYLWAISGGLKFTGTPNFTFGTASIFEDADVIVISLLKHFLNDILSQKVVIILTLFKA